MHLDDFFIFLGLPRQGKTLVCMEEFIIPALVRGEDVYANFWVNWKLPNFHYFDAIDDLREVRNSILCFDEFGDVMNARSWESETLNHKKIFTCHGKRNNAIVGNSQHISQIAKSALIIVSKFYYCEKLTEFPYNLLPHIVINERQITLKEIKADEAGYVINDRYDTDEYEDLEEHTHFYNPLNLIHSELDEYKKEVLHYHCSICKTRHDPPIPYDKCEKEYFSKKKYIWKFPTSAVETCPKHKNHILQVMDSPMYDTNYEILHPEKPIQFIPYHKQEKLVPYKGAFSPKQLAQQKILEESIPLL